ncbi:sialate O-acetylesterase [Pseudoclavibacter sp. AY1H1]|uniref:sialate O-acetylesterase n=1 Tax=Pseudoclavibacter sp. AY1H1 TaxID=2080584 RepID=UPI000CE75996|nr:sialate O-acetylesterase [Pseudoclavibacter sp. AY1H1]PPF38332.1 hypothetical protein C5E05_04790 [Pseudoclavibacter sp. AY1H1]
MPIVSGQVRDFGLADLTSHRLRLIFSPSNSAAMGPDGTLVLGPVVVENDQINPTTGGFQVELARTTLLRPATFFTLRAEWFSKTSDRLEGVAVIDWPLRVPAAGGALSTLLNMPGPVSATAFSAVDPGALVAVGGVWVDTGVTPRTNQEAKSMSEVVWEDLGEARAMDDPSATSLLEGDTAFRRALHARFGPMVAEALAADPTLGPIVSAMTSTLLTTELAGRDIPEGGDDRLLKRPASSRTRFYDETSNLVAAEIDESGDSHVYGPLHLGVGKAVMRPSRRFRYHDEGGRIAWEIDPYSGEQLLIVPRVHVVFGLGQSNMEGRGRPFGARLDPPHRRIHMWDWPNSALVPATVPLSSQQQQVGLSVLSVIGREVAEHDTNSAVVLVNAGVGNSGLVATPVAGSWAVDYTGSVPSLWPIARDTMTKSLEVIAQKHPGAQIIPWVFWHQGEADANTPEAAYTTALDALFTAVRTHLGDATIPIVAGGMVPEYAEAHAGRMGVRKALIGVQSRLEFTAYADGARNGGGSQNLTDTVHYARGGVVDLGKRMWRGALRAAGASASSIPHKPLDVIVHRAGTSVTVSWSPPDSRATDYVVDYRVDGGAWTNVARPIPADTSASFSATGVVEVRVATKNGTETSEFTLPVNAIG